MSIFLVAVTDGTKVPIDKPIQVFGRTSDCDVVLESKKVSRLHCCVALVNDRLIARDLGSTNGIKLNGDRKEEFYLKDGDEFAVGDIVFQVRQGSSAGTGVTGLRGSGSPDDSTIPGVKSSAKRIQGGMDPNSGKLDVPMDLKLVDSDEELPSLR